MKEQIANAIEYLACLLNWPAPDARGEIFALFEQMIETPEQLEWLVRVLIDHVGTYPGLTEMRAIYCSRFKPKDGIETHMYGWDAAFGRSRSVREREIQNSLRKPIGGSLN